MKWNALQEDAKDRGFLVFAMDQMQTPVMKRPAAWGLTGTDGYCMGLVAKWVSLQYQGKNFLINLDKVCDTPPYDSTIAHIASSKVASSTIGRATYFQQTRAAVKVFHCTVSSGLREDRGTAATAEFWWSVMSKAYGCYSATIGGTKGAHAIGLRHGRDNRYHVFDPNHFHVALPSKSTFLSFVYFHLLLAGYGTNYGMESAIIGIRPPI